MSSYTPEPYDDDRFRVTPRRPTSVTVLAVLHLIFGSLGVLMGLCGGVTLAIGLANLVPRTPAPPPGAPQLPFPPDLAVRQQRFLEQAIPFFNPIQVAQAVALLVLAALLVVAGIG